MNPASAVGARLLGPLTATAAAILILAVSILPFLTPAWIAFEQDRAQAAAWTGYAEPDLRMVTNAILGDVVLGRGDFDVQLDGTTVLTPAERGHLQDVRGVFRGLAVLAAFAAVVLVAGFRLRSSAEGRARTWLSIHRGAVSLAGVIAILGVVAAVAFDAAFELFHRLFFASGTYDFDPRTSRLVQLFPEALFSESAIVAGAVMVALALGVAWLAGRRARWIVRRAETALPAVPQAESDRATRSPVTPRSGSPEPSVTNGAQR